MSRLTRPDLLTELAAYTRRSARAKEAATPLRPLHRFCELADLSLSEMRRRAVCRQSVGLFAESVIQAHELLRKSVSRLPVLHRRLLIGRMRAGYSLDRLAALHGSTAPLVERYLSQARAMIRIYGNNAIGGDDLPIVIIEQEALTVAQSAARWVERLTPVPVKNIEGFLPWTAQASIHSREMLIAIGWDTLMRGFPFDESRATINQ